MKRSIKTISITIDELTQILAIDDPATRQSIAQTIRTNAADEAAPIECPSDPIAECLLGKIRKKREAAARRRQVRERRKLAAALGDNRECDIQKSAVAFSDKSLMFEAGMSLLELAKNDSPHVMPFDCYVVTNVLNVVYRHDDWFEWFFKLFDRLPKNSSIGHLVRQTKDSITYLAGFIPKLKVQAQKYHSTPLEKRPSEVLL